MARVIGVGGIFFKARDPQTLSAWYAQHLGLNVEEFGGAMFHDDATAHYLIWTPSRTTPSIFRQAPSLS
jgi:hypothetical protein